MPDLMNGEDLNGADSANSVGRFSAYQWAWGYVVGGLALLWLLGYFVFRGR